MLFHTMVGSNDIERSKRFYDTVLGTLGVGEPMRNIADSGHARLIYNNGKGTNFIVSQPINDEPATVANGSTVAFACNSPEQVKQNLTWVEGAADKLELLLAYLLTIRMHVC